MSEHGSVVALSARDTYDLRRRQLRDGRIDAAVDWPDDHGGGTHHLGIVVDSRVVAISTWISRSTSTQLRGMATDPLHTGHGFGRRLLSAGIERAASHGTELVWANARVEVLGFYERAGFVAVGDVFATADTGLPHRRVELLISGVAT